MRAFLAALIVCAYVTAAGARDDGRYADSPLKSWFDQLASGKGLCCSFADGFKVENVDWDTQCERLGGKSANARERAVGEQTQTCRYRVRLHGEWIVVPDSALVTEPNKFGPAVVWPYLDADGQTQIRCFIPGAGT